ncbi:MAG: hypothetical protein KAT46_04380 [Deltaproteobacteria bacterium]|nr:hypothetical protein [Deltaproteobacteria bacterium]
MMFSISKILALLNLSVLLLFFLFLLSPLGSKPGAMHPLGIPLFLYLCLSFIPAIVGLIYAAIELTDKEINRRWVTIGIVWHSIYLLVFFSFIYFVGTNA